MRKGGIEEGKKMEEDVEKSLTNKHSLRKSLFAQCASENTSKVAQGPKLLSTAGVFPDLYQ